jgi:hypothetical protein
MLQGSRFICIDASVSCFVQTLRPHGVWPVRHIKAAIWGLTRDVPAAIAGSRREFTFAERARSFAHSSDDHIGLRTAHSTVLATASTSDSGWGDTGDCSARVGTLKSAGFSASSAATNSMAATTSARWTVANVAAGNGTPR